MYVTSPCPTPPLDSPVKIREGNLRVGQATPDYQQYVYTSYNNFGIYFGYLSQFSILPCLEVSKCPGR